MSPGSAPSWVTTIDPGNGGSGRDPKFVRGEGRQSAGNFLVAFLSGVLVAEGCAGGGVAESVHEFGEGGAGLGGEDGAGVSEVVPAQVEASGFVAGPIEDLAQR